MRDRGQERRRDVGGGRRGKVRGGGVSSTIMQISWRPARRRSGSVRKKKKCYPRQIVGSLVAKNPPPVLNQIECKDAWLGRSLVFIRTCRAWGGIIQRERRLPLHFTERGGREREREREKERERTHDTRRPTHLWLGVGAPRDEQVGELVGVPQEHVSHGQAGLQVQERGVWGAGREGRMRASISHGRAAGAAGRIDLIGP